MSLTRVSVSIPRNEESPVEAWLRQAALVRPEVDWLLATIPVAPGRARSLWTHGANWIGASPSMFWMEPGGQTASIALGAAVVIEADGEERTASIIQQASALWQRTAALRLCGEGPVRPRIFGGMSFTSGMRPSPVWSEFPEASFVLPRWLYLERHGRAHLTRAIHTSELAHGNDSPFSELVTRGESIQRLSPDARALSSPQGVMSASRSPEADQWQRLVQRVQDSIRAHVVRKVVLTQKMSLCLERAINPDWLLGRLAAESPDCSVFAVQRGSSTFLGATPEWMIRKEGYEVETEALAGSCSLQQGPETLLANPKERSEHALVVEGLRAALESLGAEASHPNEPEILRLRHLLHLRTPIFATLKCGQHILELVERMHPSPAVGGIPSAAAIDAIRELESESRGWYAAPVGWFDSAGNGRFVIGLRSGLVRGHDAHVFAGAGIMPDSEPALELAEIGLKQRAFLRALGVDE